MELSKLVSSLPAKKGAVCTVEGGKVVRRSYPALFDDVVQAREALRRWGVRAGVRVGIYAPNSYHWLVYDLALIDIGAISVPFTDDFLGAIDEKLLERYNIALLLLSKSGAQIFPQKPPHVAFIDGENETVRVIERSPSHDGDEADQHSLVFSSGSAGGLKGLVISRKGIETTLPPLMEAIGVTPRDGFLLFLPMANFQQRNMCYCALWYDFDVLITDYTQLFPAMKALHPTILVAPPILFQMIYAEFARYPAWKRSLWMTLGAALSLLPIPAIRRGLARLLFRDFYQQFGDRIRLLITGMAPIQRNIGQFFNRIQLPLCESYGMMESGSLTYRSPNSKNYRSVGKLIRDVQISFEEDGEIIVRRQHPLTLRYFQCADGENERTFIGAGRIATGDTGELDKDGYLYLQGRKKMLIVTPGGYKIHPELIEEELNNLPGVAHSIFFLRAGASHLTCVVSPTQPDDEAAKTRIKAHINQMQAVKKAAQFVEVIFADEAFSTENKMLRPNMKVDRKQIAARYDI